MAATLAAAFAALAAAAALPLALFEPDGIPSPSAASGKPGMSLRLWTRTRRESLKVISTLLSDITSVTNPLPNLGWVTMTFSV